MRIVSLLAVCALLGGAGAAGCSKASKKMVAEIALEAAGVIAPGAFIPAPGTDLQGVKALPRSGEKAAEARGVIGGTPGKTRCDKSKLVTELLRDPAKAAAWAKIRKIPVDKIEEHVKGLSEGHVLVDTLVRNHNYQGDGKTVSYLSVVQVGTALLFDEYRNPAVKCNCGNPLLQPENNIDRMASTYTGQHWESFQNSQVTVIAARPLDEGPMKTLPLVDAYQPDKGFDRPVGSDGADDSKTFPVPPPSAPTPSRSGSGSGSGSPSGTPSDTPSGTPTGGSSSGSRPPSSGGTATSRPPTTAPPSPSRTAPPRTGSPMVPPSVTSKPPTRSAPPVSQPPPRTASAAPPVHTTSAPRPPKTAPPPVEHTVAPPPKTAAPPVEHTVAPPPRTAAPPVERTAAPPPRTAAPPVERTLAPPPKTAAPPVERTVAPPPRTAAPPAATAPGLPAPARSAGQ
ncbi:DUF6777 domain-containing protein [Streptomyces sp. NPDC021096]|uniref:DUF6777 domain-containing protein n=1 Tax=Streptomyces sp. NPDC021096 TaxID=3154792 RepID=UPI0033F6B5D1